MRVGPGINLDPDALRPFAAVWECGTGLGQPVGSIGTGRPGATSSVPTELCLAGRPHVTFGSHFGLGSSHLCVSVHLYV